MDYVLYDPETGELKGAFTGQEPAEGDFFLEVSPELRAAWVNYRMNEARDGLELAPTATPATPRRQLTQYAFRERFSGEEKVRIDLASLDNPGASLAERTKAAAVRVMLADIAAARVIDLDWQKTRDGVQALEAAGILEKGRAEEILDTPVAPHEAP